MRKRGRQLLEGNVGPRILRFGRLLKAQDTQLAAISSKGRRAASVSEAVLISDTLSRLETLKDLVVRTLKISILCRNPFGEPT